MKSKSFFSVALFSASTPFIFQNCGRSSRPVHSSVKGLNDADLIEAMPDGNFRVRCRDGIEEIATQEQITKGEICLASSPPSPPPPEPMCGIYKKPVRIPHGDTTVTCDVTFEEDVFIEAGANILTDGDWNSEFKNVFAQGTSQNPIAFKAHPQTPDASWKKIQILGTAPVVYDGAGNYKSGAYIKNVSVDHANHLHLSRIFMTDSKIKSAKLEISEGYFGRGILTSQKYSLVTLEKSYFIWNKATGPSDAFFEIKPRNSFIAWNNFNVPGFSLGSADLSYILFNDFTSTKAFQHFNINNIIFEGNTGSKILEKLVEKRERLPLTGNCELLGKDNPNAILTGIFPLIPRIEQGSADFVSFPMVAAGPTGWKFDSDIESQLVYDLAGEEKTNGQPWQSGYFPKFNFPKPESYRLKLRKWDGNGSVCWPKLEIVYRPN